MTQDTLLGSASVEIWLTEKDITKKFVFSGDIGNLNQPLIRDPEYIDEADYVIMEATYGNRVHEKPLIMQELWLMCLRIPLIRAGMWLFLRFR